MPNTFVRAHWLSLLCVVLLAIGPSAKAQGTVQAGGDFTLTDQNGKPFSSAMLAGQPYAIFFGFTHCPDVCPTTLMEMSNVLGALGPDADRLKVVFVSVDAERDTPEQLRTYLSSFDPRIIGLSGSTEQIAATAKIWNAFYDKIPETDGSVTIVHSAHIYLMDRDNRQAGTMNFQETEAEQLAKLRTLLE